MPVWRETVRMTDVGDTVGQTRHERIRILLRFSKLRHHPRADELDLARVERWRHQSIGEDRPGRIEGFANAGEAESRPIFRRVDGDRASERRG